MPGEPRCRGASPSATARSWTSHLQQIQEGESGESHDSDSRASDSETSDYDTDQTEKSATKPRRESKLYSKITPRSPLFHDYSPSSSQKFGRTPPVEPRTVSVDSLDIYLDDPVHSTTDASSLGKLNAVESGYYEDPYLPLMLRNSTRSDPLVNRGYYSRVAVIRKSVAAFIEDCHHLPCVQVVNIGAGLDTLYFWVQDFWDSPQVRVFETDFYPVLSKKLFYYTKTAQVWARLQQCEGHSSVATIKQQWKQDQITRLNDSLAFIAVDVRDCCALENALFSVNFDPKLPTLFIAECALTYVLPFHSDQVIAWTASVMQAPAAFVMYEQVNPHDSFGKTMVQNLEERGCPMLGIQNYPTIESQEKRFLKNGWAHVSAANMIDIYDNHLDKDEIYRIQKLELLDEVEEWRLIQSHYFVLVAIKPGTIPRVKQGGYAQEQGSKDVPNPCLNSEIPITWAALSSMCEKSSALPDRLPRFTTSELRRLSESPKARPTPIASPPKVGKLAFLTRPQATLELVQRYPDLLQETQAYFSPGKHWKSPHPL